MVLSTSMLVQSEGGAGGGGGPVGWGVLVDGWTGVLVDGWMGGASPKQVAPVVFSHMMIPHFLMRRTAHASRSSSLASATAVCTTTCSTGESRRRSPPPRSGSSLCNNHSTGPAAWDVFRGSL
eukprot:360117-Chlamydomonas_euryale.AAC.14